MLSLIAFVRPAGKGRGLCGEHVAPGTESLVSARFFSPYRTLSVLVCFALTGTKPGCCYFVQHMALPAHVLDRLPARLRQNGLLTTGDQLSAARALKLGLSGQDLPGQDLPGQGQDPWSAMLLSGEWPEGQVSELCLAGGFAGGTSLALNACRQVQETGALFSPDPSWCAFVDPSRSLYAPGVARAGVRLSHLLVVRPRPEDLVRVTLRLVESQSLPLVIVDLVGTPTHPLEVALGPWGRVVQRLSRALEGTVSRVLLLTHKDAPRPFPLRVGLRVELTRPAPDQLEYRITRTREGARGEGAALELAQTGRLPAMRVSHVA